MNFTNIKLILLREMRDQLRDRRMLFMMFVLPVLLYPLMGLSFLQLAQFLQDHPARILLIETPQLDRYPALLAKNAPDGGPRFAEEWLSPNESPDRFDLQIVSAAEFARQLSSLTGQTDDEALTRRAKHLIDTEQAEVVVAFPTDFAEQSAAFHDWILAQRNGRGVQDGPIPTMPRPKIFCNTVKDKSQLALGRVHEVLSRWQTAIGQRNLLDTHVPPDALRPFEFERVELAEPRQKESAAWSKILPMMLILWALTGAFYPAIDLCAGEKERGTLETLLCSPAARSEIVTGKILTVTLFSLITALFNLLSIGSTGWFVMNQLQGLGPMPTLGFPPVESLLWLAAALVPLAVLFSALCVALASYARSSKEGQYYLMPLLLVVMPLVFMPMDPRMELNLGNSLIPISGLLLLLRGLLEGEYAKSLLHLPPVLLITGLCCWMAIRWAVEQFNREEVLFRESERFDLRLWLRQIFSESRETPTVGMALLCAVIVFGGKFMLESALAGAGLLGNEEASGLLTKMILIPQLTLFLTPAVIMALTLTTQPLKTLLIGRTPLRRTIEAVVLAILLGLVLHPTVLLVGQMLQHLYPPPAQMLAMQKQLDGLVGDISLAWMLVLFAIVPAICEELTFRGFILSGLRNWGSRSGAIVVTAVLFGLIHGILHQTINAVLLGIVLGYLAVKSGSLWPCIAFHATNNATKILQGAYQLGEFGEHPWLNRLLAPAVKGPALELQQFQPYIIIGGILAAGLILAWFGRLPGRLTQEEAVWDQISRNRKLELT